MIDDKGETRPAEAASTLIAATSNIEKALYRLYYDQEDEAMVAHLRQEKWLT